MRIEINSGGLGSLAAVAGYQANMVSFVNRAEDVISSFKTVRKQTQNLSGGVGRLQSALDDVNARIQKEETKVEAVIDVYQKTNQFLELAKRVDKQVAAAVNCNRDQFYKSYPHLKPAGYDNESKSWLDKAWEWVCDKVTDGIDWVVDTTQKVIDSILNFFEDNKETIAILLKATFAVTVLLLTVVLVTSLPGMGILIVGIACALIAGFGNATDQLVTKGEVCWKELAWETVAGGVQGALVYSGLGVLATMGSVAGVEFLKNIGIGTIGEQTLSDVDWLKISIDSILTGMVAGGAKWLQEVLEGTKIIGGDKVAASSFSNMVKGLLERSSQGMLDAHEDGQVELKEWTNTFFDTLNPANIISDGATGAVEGLIPGSDINVSSSGSGSSGSGSSGSGSGSGSGINHHSTNISPMPSTA